MSAADQSDWRTLLRIAVDLIRQANSPIPILDTWTFGGGTALMLHLQHRVSYDVDIFIDDVQVLPLLNPETQGLTCSLVPSGYETDGARFLKIAFAGVGEIDFIAAAHLTDLPAVPFTIEGCVIEIETVPEIIAKKVCYRGSSIAPRDVFDIAAAAMSHRNDLINQLRAYPEQVKATLRSLEKQNPQFITSVIADLAVLEPFCDLARTARAQTIDLLTAV